MPHVSFWPRTLEWSGQKCWRRARFPARHLAIDRFAHGRSHIAVRFGCYVAAAIVFQRAFGRCGSWIVLLSARPCCVPISSNLAGRSIASNWNTVAVIDSVVRHVLPSDWPTDWLERASKTDYLTRDWYFRFCESDWLGCKSGAYFRSPMTNCECEPNSYRNANRSAD